MINIYIKLLLYKIIHLLIVWDSPIRIYIHLFLAILCRFKLFPTSTDIIGCLHNINIMIKQYISQNINKFNFSHYIVKKDHLNNYSKRILEYFFQVLLGTLFLLLGSLNRNTKTMCIKAQLF